MGEGLWRLQMTGICWGGTLLGCVRRLGGHPERHLGVGGSQWGRRVGSSRACGSSDWQRPRLKVLGRPTCSELSFSLGSLLSRSGCRATWWDLSPTLGFLPRLPMLFPGISMGAHCPPKPAGHGLCVSEPPYPALPRLPVLCGQWSVPLPPFLVGSPAVLLLAPRRLADPVPHVSAALRSPHPQLSQGPSGRRSIWAGARVPCAWTGQRVTCLIGSQGSVPPVMAFHLGSLGFLTPFNFENFQSQVTQVIQGELECS